MPHREQAHIPHVSVRAHAKEKLHSWFISKRYLPNELRAQQ